MFINNVVTAELSGQANKYIYSDQGRTLVEKTANQLVDDQGFVSRTIQPREFFKSLGNNALHFLNKPIADVDSELSTLGVTGSFSTSESGANPLEIGSIYLVESFNEKGTNLLADLNTKFGNEFSVSEYAKTGADHRLLAVNTLIIHIRLDVSQNVSERITAFLQAETQTVEVFQEQVETILALTRIL